MKNYINLNLDKKLFEKEFKRIFKKQMNFEELTYSEKIFISIFFDTFKSEL